MNNLVYYPNNLHVQTNSIYSKVPDSPRDSKLSNDLNNYIESPNHLVFNIPKQTNFLNYPISTPPRKRNIINLNDKSKFKNSSNFNVVYKTLYNFDSLNNYNNTNLRYASPPPRRHIYNNYNNNYFIPYIPSSPSSSNINVEEKIYRMARTPEPKKINYNQFSPQNQYNINIYVNNLNNSYNSLAKEIQNIESPKRIKNAAYPYNNNEYNSYLKLPTNINVKNINNINYSTSSNENNSNNLIYPQNANNIKKQSILNNDKWNYYSPIRSNYIATSQSCNSNFNNSPERNYIQRNLPSNNINSNYYNSPKKTIYYPQNSNNSNNIQYKENNINNINIQNKYQNHRNIENKYYSPEKNDYPMDNNKQKQVKLITNYRPIKTNNYITKEILPKIPQNHVNLIPIPKKILNENPAGISSVSNFLNSSIKWNDYNYVNNANIQQNPINKIPIIKNELQTNLNVVDSFSGILNNYEIQQKIEPANDFNLNEFKINKKIGEGTFGKIYCVRWIKNNELYGLKKLELIGDELYIFKKKVRIIQNFLKKTGHKGLIKLYGDKCFQQPSSNKYSYYVLMELGERDLEKEINNRRALKKYYSENELLDIILQLVKTLSLMQKNNITHRDVKPQNILLIKGLYKLCDFGETKIIAGNGPILQSVRGSELYMSPILFYAYNKNVPHVLHNTYKSDVFSLGMCILLAACLTIRPLCDIREIKNMYTVETIIIKYLL